MRGFQGFIFFWQLFPTSVDPAACWTPKALFALLSIHRPCRRRSGNGLYEREHARAEAAEARIAELEDKLGEAEARAEEWRQESVSARCDLNVLRSVFASNKEKLAAARADLKETAPEPEYGERAQAGEGGGAIAGSPERRRYRQWPPLDDGHAQGDVPSEGCDRATGGGIEGTQGGEREAPLGA